MMEITDKLLFLQYALPCAEEGILKRGLITREQLDDAIEQVSKGKVPNGGIEKKFLEANAFCKLLAIQGKKTSIDDDVIREYFLIRHNNVVDDWVKHDEVPKGFNARGCKTHPGKVVALSRDFALVETNLGDGPERKSYRTSFVKGLKVGDDVAVHFDYVAEKIDGDMVKRMNEVGARKGRSKSVF
jgi:hypothetical protein